MLFIPINYFKKIYDPKPMAKTHAVMCIFRPHRAIVEYRRRTYRNIFITCLSGRYF